MEARKYYQTVIVIQICLFRVKFHTNFWEIVTNIEDITVNLNAFISSSGMRMTSKPLEAETGG